MSTSRKVAKNFISLSIAEIISRLLGALLGFYIARELGPNVFGQFSFAIALISFFNIFVDFGLGQLAIRDIARDKAKTSVYGTNILALQLIIALGLLALLVILLWLMPLDPQTKLITFFFGLGVIPLAFNMSYILQAHERMEFVAISRVVGQAGYAVIGFLIIFFTRDVITLPLAQFASAVIWAWLVYVFIRKYVGLHWTRISQAEVKRLARLSLPFFIAAISVQIYYNSDSIMLQFIKGEAAVGLYNSGYKLVLLVLLVGSFMVSAFFPRLSATWVNDRPKFDQTLVYMARCLGILAFPIAIGGVLTARSVLAFVYEKSEYLEATLSFQVLLMLPLIIMFNLVIGNAMVAAGQQKYNTYGTVVGAIVNIIANFMLIPPLGIVGAAMATILAEVSVFAVVFPFYKHFVNAKVLASYFVKPCLASIVMAAVIWYVMPMLPIVMTLLVAAFVYFVILVAVKGLTMADLRFLQKNTDQLVENT